MEILDSFCWGCCGAHRPECGTPEGIAECKRDYYVARHNRKHHRQYESAKFRREVMEEDSGDFYPI